MPLVTIITPVYNAARWLPEALASVRAQTFTDWEHILVDDGSTDGSLAIVESAVAQDERFRSLPTCAQGMPGSIARLGLGRCSWAIRCLYDADDLWLPEKLARSVDSMATHGHGLSITTIGTSFAPAEE